MAGRTDTDYGLVPVKFRVSLSSRPVPPSYNKGRESDLTKQKNPVFFLRRCKLRALYMPALVAIRYNRQIRAAYGRVCQKHPKEKMIGVAAAMRRLLLLIYTLWKSGEVYDETRDTTRTPRKKSPELEHGPKDSITTTEEHVDWNAVGENGQALF